MDTQIVAVFCLCDDLLKASRHREDPQCRMSDAEVLTTALVASLFFGANFCLAQRLLQEQNYIPDMLSKSRFSRRLHRIKPYFLKLFAALTAHWQAQTPQRIYALDSFPIAVCDNIRISQVKLYQGKAYHGYIGSKKRYFYGLKLQLLVTQEGQPVEFFLTPGAYHDAKALRDYSFDLPKGSWLLADKAYNHYATEDWLDQEGLHLRPFRKVNSKRPYPPQEHARFARQRQVVERTGSHLQRLLPRRIHATSALGFELKVVLFVLACSLNFLF